VKDFHLKLVVEGQLCCGIEGRREKDPQPCYGNDENGAQEAQRVGVSKIGNHHVNILSKIV
jgi:hypothetical protein